MFIRMKILEIFVCWNWTELIVGAVVGTFIGIIAQRIFLPREVRIANHDALIKDLREIKELIYKFEESVKGNEGLTIEDIYKFHRLIKRRQKVLRLNIDLNKVAMADLFAEVPIKRVHAALDVYSVRGHLWATWRMWRLYG